MAKNPSKRLPKLVLHKPTGRGYVRLNGTCHYLGPYSDPGTDEKYHRLIAEWLTNGKQLPTPPEEITVNEVAAAYWTYCESYYQGPHGKPSSSLEGVRQALRPLRKMYGTTKAVDFGPKALRGIRETWIAADLSRTTINKRVRVIKHMFKWGVSQEMVPTETHVALSTLDGLRKGRSQAREPRKVRPVPEAHIVAVKPHVSRQVWGLITLQVLTGARPGELLKLRRIDIDTKGPVWLANLAEHKTSYIDRERVIPFGPKAQTVLREFFPGNGPTDYLFSPRDARREQGEEAETHRRPDQKPNPRKTNRRVGNHYTVESYHRAITRACDIAEVTRWSPNQLRHTAATRIRREYGLEAAQVILGHARADVTQIYAEVNQAKAVEIMAQMG